MKSDSFFMKTTGFFNGGHKSACHTPDVYAKLQTDLAERKMLQLNDKELILRLWLKKN